MPLFHCTKCHHEWESVAQKSKCGWCGARGFIIGETSFEIMGKREDFWALIKQRIRREDV